MVYSAQEAVKRALASRTNKPGTCQLWTRTMLGAPSAGDRDSDGDADAVDGWKSEPLSARHTDRNPPAGAPVAWSGGRNGYGHRALSIGNRKIRSTDAGGSGRVATVDLDWVERNWGLTYLGWSETITGIMIPGLGSAPSRPQKEDDMSWNEEFSVWDPDHNKPGDKARASVQLNQARGYAQEAYRNAKQANNRADRIEKAIKALSKGLGKDVQEAVEAALKDAVIDVDVNVNSGG